MATLSSIDGNNTNKVDTFSGGVIPEVTVTHRNHKSIWSKILNGVKKGLEYTNGFFTSPIGGVLTSLGSTLLQNTLTRNSEKRANAEYDRRFNNINAYNDPSAVAERYRKAGINPLSALGGSAIPAANPTVTQSGVPNTNLTGGVLNASQAGLVEQQTGTEIHNEKLAELHALYEEAIAKNKPELFEVGLKQAKEDLETSDLNQEEIKAQTEYINKQIWLADLDAISKALGWDLTAANIANVYSQVSLNEAQAYRIYELTPAEKQQFFANIDKIIAETEEQTVKNRFIEAKSELEVAIMGEQEKDIRNQRRNRTWNTVFNGLSTTAQVLSTVADFVPAGRTAKLIGTQTDTFDGEGVLKSSTYRKNYYE